MLVLARKKHEVIVIIGPDGSQLELHVSGLRKDKVRLGFEAPESYRILRKEVLDRARSKASAEKGDTP